MSDQPKCDFCGKFLSNKELEDKSKTGSEMTYTYEVIPEPWGPIFWHRSCHEKNMLKTAAPEEKP